MQVHFYRQIMNYQKSLGFGCFLLSVSWTWFSRQAAEGPYQWHCSFCWPLLFPPDFSAGFVMERLTSAWGLNGNICPDMEAAAGGHGGKGVLLTTILTAAHLSRSVRGIHNPETNTTGRVWHHKFWGCFQSLHPALTPALPFSCAHAFLLLFMSLSWFSLFLLEHLSLSVVATALFFTSFFLACGFALFFVLSCSCFVLWFMVFLFWFFF